MRRSEVSKYLARVGRRGGAVRSAAKREAAKRRSGAAEMRRRALVRWREVGGGGEHKGKGQS